MANIKNQKFGMPCCQNSFALFFSAIFRFGKTSGCSFLPFDFCLLIFDFL